ncbi:hypothetical protein AURDEDRAFT_178033 [Auricularia subglabra TFB-10046 SS5]|uniref:Uncharacterized protein n=1 Tax=Auricularia subglabra (strain TFB-10046 / SS5) TaxID=717982 RepID=J0L917_AURST|nr:hypothetical protein AURDEDRAFT_178033 [Auricularia subglabra TFB-10046 SS5]
MAELFRPSSPEDEALASAHRALVKVLDPNNPLALDTREKAALTLLLHAVRADGTVRDRLRILGQHQMEDGVNTDRLTVPAKRALDGEAGDSSDEESLAVQAARRKSRKLNASPSAVGPQTPVSLPCDSPCPFPKTPARRARAVPHPTNVGLRYAAQPGLLSPPPSSPFSPSLPSIVASTSDAIPDMTTGASPAAFTAPDLASAAADSLLCLASLPRESLMGLAQSSPPRMPLASQQQEQRSLETIQAIQLEFAAICSTAPVVHAVDCQELARDRRRLL